MVGRYVMKEVTIKVQVDNNITTHTLQLDADSFAKFITGYVLEGYKVQRADTEGVAIIATNGKAIVDIRLGE